MKRGKDGQGINHDIPLKLKKEVKKDTAIT
jgi:hypothetical protein